MKKKLLVMVLMGLAVLLCAGSALAEDSAYYCNQCEKQVTVKSYSKIDDDKHALLCENGHSLGTQSHDFTGATCTTKGKCVCGAEGEYGGHDWSFTLDWAKDYSSCSVTAVCKNDSRHTCTTTATIEHYVYSPAKCKDKEDGVFRHDARFTIEGHPYQISKEIPIPYTHDYQLISTAENGDKTYTCSNCGDTYTEKHEHDYKLTSTKNGDKTYTCESCGDSYTVKHSHWYGEWSPNGDATHTANCKHCGHAATIDCETFEYAFTDENGEASTFSFCPVCGEMNDGTRMAIVEDADAEGEDLPKGEGIVRSNGEFMSIGFEYFGSMTQPTKPVTITIPAEIAEGYTLTIFAPDGTETALETTDDGETVQFTLDFGETPVVLIRMTAAE